MIGNKLLLALLPLLAFGNAQNTGWTYSSPFARFPPRFIPRPVYNPPTIVQTTLPPPVTRPATPIYPSSRSTLIPTSFEPAQRLPTFFRPRAYTQSPPAFSSSPASPAQKPTIIVYPGDHSESNTPMPNLTIVYPTNYNRPGDVPLTHESEIIPQPSSSTESEPQQTGYQPQEFQPAFPSRPALILDQNQSAPEPAQTSLQPQPEFTAPEIQPSPSVPQPINIQSYPQSSLQAQPEVVAPQVPPSPQLQPEAVASQAPSSPQSEQEAVAPQVPPSAKSEPEAVAPQVPLSPQPQPEDIAPQTTPSSQSELDDVELLEPSSQSEPIVVASQAPPSLQLKPEAVAPLAQPFPETEAVVSLVQPSSQQEPEVVVPPLQQAQPIHLSSPTDPRTMFVPISPWSKPSWPQFTKPSTIPNHPYPWMPTTALPIPLPSRTTTTPAKPILLPSRTSTTPLPPVTIISIPTTAPTPKLPIHSGQLIGLKDYKCAQSNSYFSVPNQCDTFIECKANTAMQVECPDGLHFNPNAVWPEYPCDYPSQVNCGANFAKQVPQPTTNCPRQFGYFPSPSSDCGKYTMCQKGKATEMSCPAGLAFNPVKSICDWPADVPSCNPDVFQGFICPAPDMDGNGKPSDFISKFRQGKSCKLYIACQQGKPRLLRCDDGFSYDDATQSCIDSDLVTDCT